MSAPDSRRFQIREAPYPDDIAAVVESFAGDNDVCWLDGAPAADAFTSDPARRWSVIGVGPAALLDQPAGRPATLTISGQTVDQDASGWRLLRRAGKHLMCPPGEWGLGPGWIGHIGFEASRMLERLPSRLKDDSGVSLMRLARFDAVIVLDHARRAAAAIGINRDSKNVAGGPGSSVDALAQRFRAAVEISSRVAANQSQAHDPPGVHAPTTRDDYRAMIQRALRYIAEGDIYQVNLSHCLRLDRLPSSFAVFRALRVANPAPYSALLRWRDFSIASASPELMLRVDGEAVCTRPIKGTRPCTRNHARDVAARRELMESRKDAAELAMIVDLHRNDLGRVCAPGSVTVVEPRGLEVHPRVFHTVATIRGRLASGRNALDALEASFPAGSISGVPKIRALEIIDELEHCARGAYTGAIGWLGFDGRLRMNVAIRTLQICGERATLHVGGGVVAESDPDAEYDETLAKARGILEALGAPPPGASDP
ncbi:MAG: anthranilate synthase component I family protein [Phycisphaerae bacterium]